MPGQQEIAALGRLVNQLIDFAVAYGFQILGALVFLLVGLKLAAWAGARIAAFAENRKIDLALSRFLGLLAKVVMVVFVVIITLGNFGISIAPLIALAGASAFGATLAIQGPLSNYGAGLSIILSRPFTVGDTIAVQGVSGVVEDITLAHTALVGEDGERIIIPNKEIVGRVIVNSAARRIVEGAIAVPFAADVDGAVAAVRQALAGVDGVSPDPAPQAGIHDFTPGGALIGYRAWVPSRQYFAMRYRVNGAVRDALGRAGVPALPPVAVAGTGFGPRAEGGRGADGGTDSG